MVHTLAKGAINKEYRQLIFYIINFPIEHAYIRTEFIISPFLDIRSYNKALDGHSVL